MQLLSQRQEGDKILLLKGASSSLQHGICSIAHSLSALPTSAPSFPPAHARHTLLRSLLQSEPVLRTAHGPARSHRQPGGVPVNLRVVRASLGAPPPSRPAFRPPPASPVHFPCAFPPCQAARLRLCSAPSAPPLHSAAAILPLRSCALRTRLRLPLCDAALRASQNVLKSGGQSLIFR